MQGSARILAECHVLGLQIWNRLLFQVRIYIGILFDPDAGAGFEYRFWSLSFLSGA